MNKHTYLILAALLTSASTQAFAQAAPPAPAPDQDALRTVDKNDIIVTARKRQESILKVPVIETVLSPVQIQSRNLQTVTDVATLTPGLVLGLASLEVGTQVSIRGIGTTSLDPGIDQSVSLNLDGLQITQGAAYSVGLFDMQQIEILKGPQALFFGKNSPAGVIAIRSNDPTDKFELMGRTSYEFYAHEWIGEGVVSGPVTDTLGLRLAAHYGDYGGYFFNDAQVNPALGGVAGPHRFGHTTSLYLRGTALWKPDPSFSARLKLNYTRDREEGGAPYQLVSCPQGINNYTGIAFYSPNEDCKVDRTINIAQSSEAAFGDNLRKNGENFTDITQKFGTLEMNYEPISQVTLTSVTGYYNLLSSVALNGTLGAQQASIVADKVFRRKEVTQEVRATSDFSSPLNFTAGAFYQHGTMTNDVNLFGNTLLGLPAILQQGTHDVHINSISGFGQLRYKPFHKFEISAGVRYTNERRSDYATRGFFGGPITPVDPQPPKIRSRNWSPELTLTYTPTDDVTIFGSLKQAYKSGSYNLIVPVPVDSVPTTPANNNSFGDERVRGGEVGLKARLADRQVYTNLSFYYYKYNGLQVGINEAEQGGLTILRTVNAGSAKIYGVDFDATYHPEQIQGLTLRGAVNWNHARFTDFKAAQCWGGQTFAQGCNQVPTAATADEIAGGYAINGQIYNAQDLSGTPLPRAPMWQATGGFTYEMPAAHHATVVLGVDGQYSSKYLTNLGLNRLDYYQKAYGKISANIAYKARNDAWELALIGNNLTGKLTTANCTNLNYAGGQVLPGAISGGAKTGPSGKDELICTFDRAREVFLRLTVWPSNF
jgi:iron complex outermembrane receptor protein